MIKDVDAVVLLESEYDIKDDNFIDIKQQFKDGTVCSELKNYFFKVKQGAFCENEICEIHFTYNDEYYSENIPLKGMLKCKGNHRWQDTCKRANEMINSTPNHKVQIRLENTYSNKKVYLQISSMSFTDAVSVELCFDQIEKDLRSEYGYKIMFYNGNSTDEKIQIPEMMYEASSTNSKQTDLVNGQIFNEMVYNCKYDNNDVNGNDIEKTFDNLIILPKENENVSFYLEKATFTDYFYSKIITSSLSKGNGISRKAENIHITQQWLKDFFENLGERKVVHVDLGGEGQFYSEDGYLSGFDDAINLNSKYDNSQLPHSDSDVDFLIPHLIKMDDLWEGDFPFDVRTVDYLTMQSVPLPLPEHDIGKNIAIYNEKEYYELIDCVALNGIISIWCANDDDKEVKSAAQCAIEFYDEYKKVANKKNGFVNNKGIKKLESINQNLNSVDKNPYLSFYVHLKKRYYLDKPCVIPVEVSLEETTYLGMKNSIILSYKYHYDEVTKNVGENMVQRN